jgi:hypothetical protein
MFNLTRSACFSGLSHSYSTQRDKSIVQLSKLADSNRRFISRNSDTPHSINEVSFFITFGKESMTKEKMHYNRK